MITQQMIVKRCFADSRSQRVLIKEESTEMIRDQGEKQIL